ncbi:FecR domain-containing protein [Bdellovibrio bacteriovorus]|uniref:FecR domain-containing protein n=1 Tax=Bdellovibrio bacteriovorus TaxID=959 RepID=UPI003AA7B80F
MSRFGRTEKMIFTGALLVLMVFSYFLYDDSLLFPKSNTGELELIGSVAISQNDVRRKNLDTFSWLPASRKDNVFQNDSIFTGDRSEATIQLQDGTQIRIEPNSLITLNLKNGQMNLDLRYGNLVGELAQGSSLTIKSGTEEFKLEGSPTNTQEKPKIKFNKAHSGTVDLKLLSGDVKYIDKKKQAVKELPKNAVVAVKKDGDIKPVEKPTLLVKTPDNMNWLRVNPDDPLPFEWQGKGDIARYELEVSPNEDFSSVALSKMTNEQRVAVTEPLQPGPYFWRLKTYDRNGEVGVVSPAQRMSITHLAGPQIVTPVQAAQINLELKVKPQEELATTTEVQWKAMAQLKHFTWQIAADPEFQQIIKDGQTDSLAAVTPRLPSGTYWVRVQGQTAGNNVSPWSEPVSFTLNLAAHKEERPNRPVLITKQVDFKAPTGERNPASPEAPKLAWKPVLRSKGYQLQISKDISFAEVEKYDITQNQVAWSQFRPGKHYYRVQAKGINGLNSDFSEVGTIDVSVGGLTLNPLKTINAVGQAAGPKETPISWSEVPFAKSYLVQVDKSKEFTAPQQLEYSATGGNLTLQDPGTYVVRVQALDEANKPLTDFSNIQEVMYTFRTPLVAPPLMEPFNNASIFLQTEMEPFIWLEWKKVEGATSYRIEISDKPDFSRTLIAKSLAGNRFLIKEKVPLGKIYWRVRAEAKGDAEMSEWAEKREFTLYHQKNETFVK